MRSATRALVVALVLALPVFAAPPRISFMRTMPAPHDLGQAEELAVIYALGDTDVVRSFVEMFVEHTNESNVVRLTDATKRGQNFIGEKPDDVTVRKLRRSFPADAYLGVNEFTCRTTPREGESSAYDVDRKRVKRKVLWLDAICTARIDVISAADFRRTMSFAIKGEGTSPRVEEMTDDVRNIALQQAARYASVAAAEEIVPRRVRESIPLDDTAPQFAEGMSLIELARLDGARALWEDAAKKNPRSAALHYNLGVVCEALGDVDAARAHYIEARRLSPQQQRYEDELKGFIRRNVKKP